MKNDFIVTIHNYDKAYSRSCCGLNCAFVVCLYEFQVFQLQGPYNNKIFGDEAKIMRTWILVSIEMRLI